MKKIQIECGGGRMTSGPDHRVYLTGGNRNFFEGCFPWCSDELLGEDELKLLIDYLDDTAVHWVPKTGGKIFVGYVKLRSPIFTTRIGVSEETRDGITDMRGIVI